MEHRTAKKRNFSQYEKFLLHDLIVEQLSILQLKKTDTITNYRKMAAYKKIAETFNSLTKEEKRTCTQIQNYVKTTKCKNGGKWPLTKDYITRVDNGPTIGEITLPNNTSCENNGTSVVKIEYIEGCEESRSNCETVSVPQYVMQQYGDADISENDECATNESDSGWALSEDRCASSQDKETSQCENAMDVEGNPKKNQHNTSDQQLLHKKRKLQSDRQSSTSNSSTSTKDEIKLRILALEDKQKRQMDEHNTRIRCEMEEHDFKIKSEMEKHNMRIRHEVKEHTMKVKLLSAKLRYHQMLLKNLESNPSSVDLLNDE